MAADARTWSTPIRSARDRRRNRSHIEVSGDPWTNVMLSPVRYEVADTARACRRPSLMFASMFSGLTRVSRNLRRGLVSTRPRVAGAMRAPPVATVPAIRMALPRREGTSVRMTVDVVSLDQRCASCSVACARSSRWLAMKAALIAPAETPVMIGKLKSGCCRAICRSTPT